MSAAAAAFPWQGQELPYPRTAQKVYIRQYLFEVDNSFPGKFLMGSNRLKVAKFNCNQNKQNIFMWSGQEVGWYQRELLVVISQYDARACKEKDKKKFAWGVVNICSGVSNATNVLSLMVGSFCFITQSIYTLTKLPFKVKHKELHKWFLGELRVGWPRWHCAELLIWVVFLSQIIYCWLAKLSFVLYSPFSLRRD